MLIVIPLLYMYCCVGNNMSCIGYALCSIEQIKSFLLIALFCRAVKNWLETEANCVKRQDQEKKQEVE